MIPKAHITAWRTRAPWLGDAQVEQDLIISRAIVELFRVPEIASSLVFRGGTALYKLYLDPPARYSEDIDLVQARPEPIGDTLDRARAVLDPWLGVPRRLLKEGRVNLVYRFDPEDAPPLKLRLKVEINTREHFTELGVVRVPFRVDNPWITGAADASTYVLDELESEAVGVTTALDDFSALWEAMTPANRYRLVNALVREVLVDEPSGGGHRYLTVG